MVNINDNHIVDELDEKRSSREEYCHGEPEVARRATHGAVKREQQTGGPSFGVDENANPL